MGIIDSFAHCRPRFFYGWWIVIAYVVINLYWAGTLAFGLTIFFTPIQRTFGWSAALLAAIFSLENLLSSVLAPLVGSIFDRHGPRALMLTATALTGTGVILVSRSTSLATFTASFALLSVGFAIWGAGTGPAVTALWFVRRRGTAMGLVVAGSAVGGVMLPIWSFAVAAVGWRSAFLVAGVVLLCISFPCCLVLRHRPEQYGLAPDGRTGPAKSTAILPAAPSIRFGASLRTAQFWVIATTAMLAALGIGATGVHILPSLRQARFSVTIAVAMVTAMSLLGIPGRLGAGWLADRASVVLLLLLTYALETVGLLLLAGMSRWQAAVIPAVFAYGIGSGCVFLVPSLVLVRFFGTAAFGRIQGILLMLTGLGRVVGPILAGAIQDRWHSYAPAYLLLAILALIACLPIMRLRPPKPAKSA